MCGVVAYYSAQPKMFHFNHISNLLVQSKIRGLHAYGISYFRLGKLHNMKTHVLQDILSLLGSPSFLSDPPHALIAHNRYSTSGDWQQHSNNQPIVIQEAHHQHALVFNGVIDQGERADWQRKFGKRYVTDNDGEIVLREIIDDEEGWPEWFNKQRFSFAGAVLDSQGTITIFRNARRPLWNADYGDAQFFASTSDILARSSVGGKQRELRPHEIIRMKKQ